MSIRPCDGKWALFDSTDMRDHIAAKAICETCPAAQVADCRRALTDTQKEHPGGPRGTWGGLFVTKDGRTLDINIHRCRNGHKQDPDDPYIVNGKRRCRQCHVDREKRRYARKHAELMDTPLVCPCGTEFPRRPGRGAQAKFCGPCKTRREQDRQATYRARRKEAA